MDEIAVYSVLDSVVLGAALSGVLLLLGRWRASFAVLLLFGAFHLYANQRVVEGGAVVITGCSSGIGRDAALHLLKKGFVVYATLRRDTDAAALREAAAEAVGSAQAESRLRTALVDVRSEESAVRLAQRVAAETEEALPLVGVVLNAGVTDGSVPLEVGSVENVAWVMDVNFLGVVRVAKAFIPQLRRDKGRLVLISSLKALMWLPGDVAYSSSKVAAERAMECLASELTPYGAKVSVLRPDYFVTEIGSNEAILKRKRELYEKRSDPVLGSVYPGFFKKLSKELNGNPAVEHGFPVSWMSEEIEKVLTQRLPPRFRDVGGLNVWRLRAARLLPNLVSDPIAVNFYKFHKVD